MPLRHVRTALSAAEEIINVMSIAYNQELNRSEGVLHETIAVHTPGR